MLCTIGAPDSVSSAVHFVAQLDVNDYIPDIKTEKDHVPNLIMLNVLFDTGALGANYIIIKSSFEDKYGQQSHMTITCSICNTIN